MNTVDIVVIAVIVISALIAFLRGFVREVLTIGSWLGAALVTLYGFPLLSPRFEQWIPSSQLAAHAVCGVSLFIVSLIVFSVISHQIAKVVRGSALTAVDRSLGLLFGLLRGGILVSLSYMLVMWISPDMLAGARTLPMMAKGAEILKSMAPKELADELPPEMSAPPPQPTTNINEKNDSGRVPAYNERQRAGLQRLIDATTGK